MYTMQYLCFARTWTSQAVPCLCIHEEVFKRMSFYQMELNHSSTLWGITGCFFFICKCASLKKNAKFCQRQLIKHLWVSVSVNCKIINLCCKKNSWGSVTQTSVVPFLIWKNNIYIFGKNVVKNHPNGSTFSRVTSTMSLWSHLFKASKWIF